MGLSRSDNDHLFQKCRQICSSINVDSKVTSNAWSAYETARNNYTLEGDQLHWIGCAIYIVCRKETIPSISSRPSILQGLCISLTKLLRLCSMSVTQFFTKVKLWLEMTKSSQGLRLQIETMEKNFAVSYIIFKKYHPIFADLFQMPKQDFLRQCRLKKGRIYPVNVARIFEFCWTLYLCMRSEYPESCSDLVNSYHLLVSCLNMAYQNTLAIDKYEFFNPEFPGIMNRVVTVNGNSEMPCLIDAICDRHDGVRVDAKFINEYCWKVFMRKFLGKGMLCGNQTTHLGLFSNENFDHNVRNVNRAYESFVLGSGVFDERIFLTEFKRVQMMRNASNSKDSGNDFENGIVSEVEEEEVVITDHSEDILKLDNTPIIDEITNSFNFRTPLTGRQYLMTPNFQNSSPADNVKQSIAFLQNLLADCQAQPSESLLVILQKGSQFPLKKIMVILDEIGTRFCLSYTIESEIKLQIENESDFAQNRVNFAKILYFKLLEAIVKDEIKRNPHYDIGKLIENELFHRCLITCCLEIVIHSYNSQREFPWILKTLKLPAYYFYRVIELIIRTKESFSRQIIKYLNTIEERILEQIVWEEESPIWESIKTAESIPQCEEVSIPGRLTVGSGSASGSDFISKAHLSSSLKMVIDAENQRTPIATSAFEHINSPGSSSSSAVKKKLFSDQIEKHSNVTNHIEKLNRNAKNASVMAAAVTAVATASKTIDLINANILPSPRKPKRTGSTALFFRKFYYMCALRLEELCLQLSIFETEFKQRIWTLFEYLIVNETHLLKNRHVDQLIMCSVYVLCKTCKVDKFFTDIMNCYRSQPQATRFVYRNVLLIDQAENPKLKIKDVTSDNYGDLIKFYNTVFVKYARNVVTMLACDSECNTNIVLSPLPVAKPKSAQVSSKRKISDNIFIRILSNSAANKRKLNTADTEQFSYYFNRSPSKVLNTINEAISKNSVPQRIVIAAAAAASATATDTPNTNSHTNLAPHFLTVSNSQKLQNLIGDRAIANNQQNQ